ncbi:hypothetical protein [Streptacidiphilus sp. EB129]|jgi:hypothetical protein|uniref:hypothetical protein n=1 Tax=Streptacidiphilus sp. EB129 TaxID=3156262 RepID=UPI003515D999
MDEQRAERLVAALRARGVLAHLAELGVYEFAVRVVLADDEGEAIWDSSDALGLEAEVLQDGVLMGFVPHVRGSERMSEQELVEVIATTEYAREGLHPPTGGDTPSGPAPAPDPGATERPAAPPPPAAPGPAAAKRRWWSRGSAGRG